MLNDVLAMRNLEIMRRVEISPLKRDRFEKVAEIHHVRDGEGRKAGAALLQEARGREENLTPIRFRLSVIVSNPNNDFLEVH